MYGYLLMIIFVTLKSINLLIMNAEEMHQKTKEVHHGANVKRFREMQGIKQETLAEKIVLINNKYKNSNLRK